MYCETLRRCCGITTMLDVLGQQVLSAKNVPDGGPPPVRDRANIMGLADVPPSHRRELEQANLLVERTTALLHAARDAGAEFILEHSADRGHISSPLYTVT
eukprot:3362836-Pleurochrysis_carterae.AAC.1